MKLKIPYLGFFKRNEDVIIFVLAFTLFLPITIIIILLVIMLMVISSVVWFKRRVVGPRKDLKSWFAWYPVNVRESFFDDNDYRWLEMVERSLTFERPFLDAISEMDAHIIYREIKK